MKGKITLRSDQPLSDPELWALSNRLLIDQGSTTIRSAEDDTIAVVKLSAAAAAARLESLDALPDPTKSAAPPGPFVPGPGFRRIMVPVQRCSTKDAMAAVQLVLSKSGGGGTGGTAAESEQAGFLILADLTPNLDAALQLLARLDAAAGGASVRTVPARNTDATRLATLAKQLADKRKLAGGRDLRGELIPAPSGSDVLLICPLSASDQWLELIAAADQREPVERRTYTTGAFAPRDVASLIEQTVHAAATGPGASASLTDDRWKLIFDDLTGSLIISATAAQHDQITELFARLASAPSEARRPVRSFKIKNRSAKEVQQLVEDLLRVGVLQAQAGADNSSLAPSGSQQLSARPVPPGALVPGTEGPAPAPSFPLAPTNSRAPARASSATALTLTSDEPTNTLIAIGEPRLMAQLEQLLPSLDVRQPQVMLEAILVSLSETDSLSLGVELEKLQFSGDTFIKLSSLFGLSSASGSGPTATRSAGDSAGFSGVVLNPGDFSVVLRALQTINRGRSLSQPRILVNNNQQATFNSVLQQPFASTNASTTVSTTSFGGTQDAGTTISVKPQIAEGDHLVLTYSVSLSSFVGAAANANLPPPRQQNSVQSTATIPDGYTVVVGGLELVTSGEGVSQVPLLGSIPILGEVFKNRANSSGRQRFYVFLRATVLRQSNLEDLKYISDHDTAAARIPTGWPEVEPLIIGGEHATFASDGPEGRPPP